MNSSIIENKEKAVAFIVARLTSSRLPKKQLRTIGDRTILEWIINNLRQCEQVDDIVIATVAEPDNQPHTKPHRIVPLLAMILTTLSFHR